MTSTRSDFFMFTTWQMQRNQQSGPLAISGHQQHYSTQQLSWSKPWPKNWRGAPCYQGVRSDQGSGRYPRRGQISFIIFTIRKISDWWLSDLLWTCFQILGDNLDDRRDKKFIVQGLFRKYYGVECKHPSVYSKDIVEMDWYRVIWDVCSVCLILCRCLSAGISNMITFADRLNRGGRFWVTTWARLGSFLDVFWSLFSFYIIHLLSTGDKITATNYLL